jgi:hypothetical protein
MKGNASAVSVDGAARRVAVSLAVWGVTAADQTRAIDRAIGAPSRRAWEFVETERVSGGNCPLDLNAPDALAAEAGHHWAYVARRVEAQ